MTTRTVIYSTTTKLSCGCVYGSALILCVPQSITIANECGYHNRTIDATLQSEQYLQNCQFGYFYKYTITYDDAQLEDDVELTAAHIQGIVCRDCNNNWVLDQIACLEGGGGGTGWLLEGNADTEECVNFLGTTDEQGLMIRVGEEQNGIAHFQLNNNIILGYTDCECTFKDACNEIAGPSESSEDNLIAGGRGHEIGGDLLGVDNSTIVGGSSCEIEGESSGAGIFSSVGSEIRSGEGCVIVGSASSTIEATEDTVTSSGIFSGESNTVENSNFSVILGGYQHVLRDDAHYSSILGGSFLQLGALSVGFNATPDPDFPVSVDLSTFTSIGYWGNIDTWIGNTDNVPRKLKLFGPNSDAAYSGAFYTSHEAQAQATNIEYVWPATLPSPGDVLTVQGVVGNIVTLEWA